VPAKVFLSFFFFFPHSSITAVTQLFLPFVKYVIKGTTSITDGLSFGQQRVHLGANWN